MALQVLSASASMKYATLNEAFTVTATVKNTGAATDVLHLRFSIEGTTAVLYKGTFTLGKNKTGTFTVRFDGTEQEQNWIEVMKTRRLAFMTVAAVADQTSSESIDFNFGIIDARYSPKIDLFEVERTADESESVWASIKLSLADGLTETQIGRMVCEVSIWDYTTNAHTVTLPVSSLLTGVTRDTTIFTETFAKGSDYLLTMNFYDSSLTEYAPEAQTSLSHAFANLHLSGTTTGGACFGGFCQSTEGNPMLESRYPIYAYEPIHAMKGITNICCGRTETAVHANGSEESVAFGQTFPEVPAIMICMDSDDTGTSFGGCFISVRNATESGFTIRYANTSGSERKFAVRWFAYCPTC